MLKSIRSKLLAGFAIVLIAMSASAGVGQLSSSYIAVQGDLLQRQETNVLLVTAAIAKSVGALRLAGEQFASANEPRPDLLRDIEASHGRAKALVALLINGRQAEGDGSSNGAEADELGLVLPPASGRLAAIVGRFNPGLAEVRRVLDDVVRVRTKRLDFVFEMNGRFVDLGRYAYLMKARFTQWQDRLEESVRFGAEFRDTTSADKSDFGILQSIYHPKERATVDLLAKFDKFNQKVFQAAHLIASSPQDERSGLLEKHKVSTFRRASAGLDELIAFSEQVFADADTKEGVALKALSGGMARIGRDIADLEKAVQEQSAAMRAEARDLETLTSRLAGGLYAGGLLLSLALAFFLAKSITAPLQDVAGNMGLLAGGRTDFVVTGQDRLDETGKMTRALEVFRKTVEERDRMRLEQERERVRNEEERRRAEEVTLVTERTLVRDTFGAALQALAGRDLSHRLTEQLPEAYEPLRADFNAAMTSLSQTIGRVLSSASDLKARADVINEDAGQLTSRTQEQVAQLDVSDQSLRALASGVAAVVSAAQAANQIVTVARQDAEHSGDVVKQAISAMGEIESSADEIGRIIAVIDEIAFQTNLLALNAGVEAARAGDAGRGFAVVASEVRGLAQRSASAAREIKALIEASRNKVQDGVVLVGETGNSLQRIIGNVGAMTTRVAAITTLSQSQSEAVQQVQTAMRQIGAAAQQNARMAEQTSSASDMLVQDAHGLADEVSQFSIEERSRHGAPKRALRLVG